MLKTITLLAFCLAMLPALLLPAPVAMAEEEDARRHGLGGRWNVVFDMPRGSYETPVEFVVGQTGAVTTTVLGPLGTFRVDSTQGRLDGNKLTLDADTSLGKLKINATLEGDRLRGEWFRDGLVARFLFNGEIRGLRDHTHIPKPNLQVFDSVLAQIDSTFFRPDFNGVKMQTLRERYRPRVAAARNEGEFLSLMRTMLREFRTSHLDFFATPTWSKELHPPVATTAVESDAGITWRELSPSVGYLRIESFEDGPQVVTRVDRAFAELADRSSLVIDLRGNGGGTLSAAMRLGDHLLPKAQSVGYFVSRAGLVRHRARSIDQINAAALPVFSGYYSEDLVREMKNSGALMLATGGRTQRAYRGSVVVLIDANCFSASEAFASVVKETRAATLIGRRTNGAMLSATALPVEGDWTLWLPVWDFRTARGVKIEGRGVEPDIAVTFREGQDADIAAALKFLETHATTFQKKEF
jgi:hypothetical protein